MSSHFDPTTTILDAIHARCTPYHMTEKWRGIAHEEINKQSIIDRVQHVRFTADEVAYLAKMLKEHADRECPNPYLFTVFNILIRELATICAALEDVEKHIENTTA